VRRLGFQPDSAGDLPDCRVTSEDRQVGSSCAGSVLIWFFEQRKIDLLKLGVMNRGFDVIEHSSDDFFGCSAWPTHLLIKSNGGRSYVVCEIGM